MGACSAKQEKCATPSSRPRTHHTHMQQQPSHTTSSSSWQLVPIEPNVQRAVVDRTAEYQHYHNKTRARSRLTPSPERAKRVDMTSSSEKKWPLYNSYVTPRKPFNDLYHRGTSLHVAAAAAPLRRGTSSSKRAELMVGKSPSLFECDEEDEEEKENMKPAVNLTDHVMTDVVMNEEDALISRFQEVDLKGRIDD